MVSLTSYKEQVVFNEGNSSQKNRAKGKLHQMEFLGRKSGSGMAGGGSGAAV